MQTITGQLAAAERELETTRAAYRAALQAGDDGRWRQAYPDFSGAVIEVFRLRQLAAAECPAAAGLLQA